MKKIINGKKYDTETAKEIGFYSNGGTWRDFNHVEETLYQKRTGEYFLFGEGGPNTRYAERVDNSGWIAGEQITPMSYSEAQKWCEKNLDADTYEELFGEVTEDDSRKTITANLAIATIEKAKRAAAQKGISLSALIEESLLMNLRQ